jgi:hypothetical protein
MFISIARERFHFETNPPNGEKVARESLSHSRTLAYSNYIYYLLLFYDSHGKRREKRGKHNS